MSSDDENPLLHFGELSALARQTPEAMKRRRERMQEDVHGDFERMNVPPDRLPDAAVILLRTGADDAVATIVRDITAHTATIVGDLDPTGVARFSEGLTRLMEELHAQASARPAELRLRKFTRMYAELEPIGAWLAAQVLPANENEYDGIPLWILEALGTGASPRNVNELLTHTFSQYLYRSLSAEEIGTACEKLTDFLLYFGKHPQHLSPFFFEFFLAIEGQTFAALAQNPNDQDSDWERLITSLELTVLHAPIGGDRRDHWMQMLGSVFVRKLQLVGNEDTVQQRVAQRQAMHRMGHVWQGFAIKLSGRRGEERALRTIARSDFTVRVVLPSSRDNSFAGLEAIRMFHAERPKGPRTPEELAALYPFLERWLEKETELGVGADPTPLIEFMSYVREYIHMGGETARIGQALTKKVLDAITVSEPAFPIEAHHARLTVYASAQPKALGAALRSNDWRFVSQLAFDWNDLDLMAYARTRMRMEYGEQLSLLATDSYNAPWDDVFRLYEQFADIAGNR